MIPDSVTCTPLLKKLKARDPLEVNKFNKKKKPTKTERIEKVKVKKRKSKSVRASPEKSRQIIQDHHLSDYYEDQAFEAESLGRCGMHSDPGSDFSDDNQNLI